MGLFDKVKKAIDNSGIVEAAKSLVDDFSGTKKSETETTKTEVPTNQVAQNAKAQAEPKKPPKPKAPPKPECEHGKCFIYGDNLCCTCAENISCSKKEKYGIDNRLEPELLGFYKSYSAWEKAKRDKKYNSIEKHGMDAISKFINAYQPKLSFLKEDIYSYTYTYGIRNENKNERLNFVYKMRNVALPDKCEEKIMYIWNSYKNKKLDISAEWLFNNSLYNRSTEEFKYTCNALYLFSQPDKAAAYIKNTDIIDFSRFFDEDGNIKPGGSKSDCNEKDTIFNIIEEWAHNNEYTPEEIANGYR